MPKIHILYIGHSYGTSSYRAASLRRRGYEVTHIDPYTKLPRHWALWLYHFGGLGLDAYASHILKTSIPRQTYDAVHVDSGEIIGRRAFATLQKHAPVISHLTVDNPYIDPHPEGKRWRLFHSVIPEYDLCATVRRIGVEQNMRAFGARNIMTFWQPADETIHYPITFSPEETARWACDVVFVGTWMPGRGAFLCTLLDQGIKVRIYGGRWHKAPEYERLKPFIAGGPLYDLDYSRAIAGAKIALVLLNGANDDLHTQRSAEIPAIGTLMCAPRTEHHTALFEEDREAVFFSDAEECARKCKALLADETRLKAIAQAGHDRVGKNGMFNEQLMHSIVEKIQSLALEKEKRP